jgi:hypothetical protein
MSPAGHKQRTQADVGLSLEKRSARQPLQQLGERVPLSKS